MKVPKQEIFLGNYDLAVEARLNAWAEEDVGRRIWDRDATVWIPNPAEAANTPELTNRLGWLTIPQEMRAEVATLTAFAAEVRDAGFKDVVLLGMGGSSLAPEVMMSIFGNAPDYPALSVLDSTNPEAVQLLADRLDMAHTLFLVASKSGGTVETMSFFKYFFHRVSELSDNPGDHFVAITDPGSKLQTLAEEKNFRRIFSSPPEVGGRYSALTYFGLVPAALIGVDMDKLLKRAMVMVDACDESVSALKNPALILGATLGELALAARDKLTFLASPTIAPFSVWVEQLVAESTGKRKTGILPIANEPLATLEHYGGDRVFAYLRLTGDDNDLLDKEVETLKLAGHPVIEITLHDCYDIAQEFFRWELATAAAGAVLSINPFDQPNVEEAKIKARELMATYQETGELPTDTPALVDNGVAVFGDAGDAVSVTAALAYFEGLVASNNYIAIMAYVPPSTAMDNALMTLQRGLRDKLGVAVTVGYGPRFLHSTGQLHKGGNNKGLFLQITHQPAFDVPIPGEPYTFGVLIAAQAQGDFQALRARGRHVLRLHFTADVLEGVSALAEMI